VVCGLAKDSQWVQNHENLFVLGPTAVGKSIVPRSGTGTRRLKFPQSTRVRLSRIDVLVIDDWAMAPLSEPKRRDFWEICEDRYQVCSLILTS
jgi:DNA replication protein DnaC